MFIPASDITNVLYEADVYCVRLSYESCTVSRVIDVWEMCLRTLPASCSLCAIRELPVYAWTDFDSPCFELSLQSLV